MSNNLNISSKDFEDNDWFYKKKCPEEIFDIRGVKVLKKQEWDRIQMNLRKMEIADRIERQEKEKKEKIKECSQNLVKNWTNTVLKGSGARQKKLAERKLRLEEEERNRIAVDEAEAQYQAEKKRMLIEEAKIKQYNQTDRVKNLHSALLYTEAIKEREAQVELKYLRELAECGRDRGYVLKARLEYEQALKEDQDRTAERIRKTKENSNFIKSQIQYNHDKRNQEAAEWLMDGENIRRLAAEHALEQQRLDELEREDQRERMRDNLRQIGDVKLLKLIDKLKDEEYDENTRIFAAAKMKMLKLRILREEELAREKSEGLEKIKKHLTTQMLARMDDENNRIKTAVIEKELQYQTEEAEKAQKRKDIQDSIDKHRIETTNRLELERKSGKQQDKDNLIAIRESDVILKEFESKRQAIRLDVMKKLAEDNLNTAKRIKEKDGYSRANRLKVEQENQNLLDLEEKVFQDYAQNIIEHCVKGNRNTYPLKVAAHRSVGGGLGPILPGGNRQAFQTSDETKLELPGGQGRGTLGNNESTYNGAMANKDPVCS